MSAEKAMVEAIAFALGAGATNADDLAQLVTEHLRKSGYSLRLLEAPVLDDMEPDTLRRARIGLGLTHKDLALHARVKTSSITKLEAGQKLAKGSTAW